MNKMKRSVYGLVIALLTTFAIGGCGLVDSYDSSPYTNFILEETIYLDEDTSSPYLDISIDYSCLTEEDDSIAQLVNRTMQRELLGADYANLEPRAAVDSFKNDYIRNYRNETGPLYKADIERNGTQDNVPSWYNQTYSMLTFLDEGRGGNMTVSANIYVDMGGAHPNQWSRWMNFDFATGKLLTLEDVFQPSAKAEIEHILLDKLIRMQAENHPEETIQTLEDLQKVGFLQMTNIYIPENFLLNKEEVLFLFNRYDIAPYSAGEIVIKVPYEEIGQWMKN